MPDWKRLIIGDAFVLQSRNTNFYRDMFLVVPFLLFTIVAVTSLFGPAHGFRVAMKCGFLSLLAIALARERVVLIGGALGFVCVQSQVSFVLKHDLIALAVSILTGVAFLLLIRSLKDYKPSYSVARGLTIASLLVVLAGGAFTFAIFHYWIRP